MVVVVVVVMVVKARKWRGAWGLGAGREVGVLQGGEGRGSGAVVS